MKVDEIKNMIIPRYDELALSWTFNIITDRYPDVLEYMPSGDQADSPYPPRQFFYSIFATLHNDVMRNILRKCHEGRVAGDESKESELIVIQPYLLEELEAATFVSSKVDWLAEKKGKALHLLKEKCDLTIRRKRRASEAFNS